MIIIEGVDKSGKTTLAKHLVQKLNGIYYKGTSINPRVNKNNSNKIFHETMMLKQLQLLNSHSQFIIDRLLWSEFSYSKVFNRDTNIELLTKCFNEINNEETIIIYLSCNDETLKNRLLKHKDEFINFETSILLKNEYNYFFNKYTPKNFITINTTYFNEDNTIKHVLKKIKKIRSKK